MIAQVFRMGPPATGAEAASEETAKFAQEAADRQREVAGCEGCYMMMDPSTGESLAVTLWRDEAAMKAGAAYQAGEIADAKKQTPAMEVPTPTVYEVFAHA